MLKKAKKAFLNLIFLFSLNVYVFISTFVITFYLLFYIIGNKSKKDEIINAIADYINDFLKYVALILNENKSDEKINLILKDIIKIIIGIKAGENYEK